MGDLKEMGDEELVKKLMNTSARQGPAAMGLMIDPSAHSRGEYLSSLKDEILRRLEEKKEV